MTTPNITEVSLVRNLDGEPVWSFRCSDGSYIQSLPLAPEEYAGYQAEIERWCAAGRRLLDEIKEHTKED